MLGLSEQILKILRQRKLISVKFHAYSNARKPPKTVAPPVLMLDWPKKNDATPTVTSTSNPEM